MLQATQRGWLDDQVAAKDGPRQQVHHHLSHKASLCLASAWLHALT